MSLHTWKDDFIQAAQCQLHRTPNVILFNQLQLSNLRSFRCRAALAHLRSVFVFNLSRKSQEVPIFIGPVTLRGDGKYHTYRFSLVCMQKHLTVLLALLRSGSLTVLFPDPIKT